MTTDIRSLKIVFISWHTCIRVIKEGIALADRGHEIHLLSNNIPGNNIFDTSIKWDNGGQLARALKRFDESYVFHVHNEPNYMVQVVRDVFPKAKIVFDVHDSKYVQYAGMGFGAYDEDVAAQIADAFVFVSEPNRKTWMKEQGLDKPYCVLPSASPKQWDRVGGWNYAGGLCSQGGHMLPGRDVEAASWRDYTILYGQLKEAGINVFAYCSEFGKDDTALDNYWSGLATLGAFPHADMIGAMGMHDWSLVGNLGDSPVWKQAMPNKFFDAMSAGVPVMNLNCPPVAKIIDKYDVGVNVSSVDEMIEKWPLYREKRANVMLNRKHLHMENQIWKLEDLYARAFD